ncbi:MAG: hypothetical protein MUP14_03655 [Dehalococcoidia bacterium]|nr:hypothetical protein [Dehalococcoidia bacterium]
MTLVVGVNSDQCAIIAADSRVTSEWRDRMMTHVDCCQKVFRIGEATIIGFCGDLRAIADILGALSQIYQQAPDLVGVESLFERLPAALRAVWQESRRRSGFSADLGLIVAGRSHHGSFAMFLCESPSFGPQSVPANTLAIMGSGSSIIEPARDDFRRAIPQYMSFDGGRSGPESVVWTIACFVENRLEERGVASVGRVFHACCVDAKGVWRIPYSLARLVDIDKKEVIVGTRIGDRNQWIQYSGDGTEIELLSPIDIVSDDNLLRNDRTLQPFE